MTELTKKAIITYLITLSLEVLTRNIKGSIIRSMKHKKVGKRVCEFRLGELADAKGISKRSVSKDIKEGRFDPNNLLSLCKWLIEPRYNKNKGRPLFWLHNKSGKDTSRGGEQ